ncbi:MAG: ABC transporter ATP-binding protein, partial [Shinella sp.]|nr:ABC transporter ATP-binding protein [Shinella sp.]
VRHVCDRIAVMYLGKVAEHGPVGEIYERPAHPYTRALLGSIPPLTGEKPRRLPAIPGSPPSLLRLPQGCAFGPRCPLRYDACVAEKPALGDGPHAAACLREAQA